MKYIKHKKHLFYFFLLSLTIFFVITPITILAANQDSTPQRIFDDANLLTKEEHKELEALYETYVEKNKLEIRIFTVETLHNTLPKYFLEDYFDNNNCGYGDTKDCVLMVICMDPNNRGIHLQGYGQAEYNIDDNRCDAIYQSIRSDMSNGNYVNAFELFITEIDKYWNMKPVTDYTHTEEDNKKYDSENSQILSEDEEAEQNLTSKLGIFFVISVLIGGIVVSIMCMQSGGKVTTNQRTYLDYTHSHIISQYDRYTHTHTTKRAKPKPPDSNHSSRNSRSSRSSGRSNSFRGGGGTSRGGSSHSGGGGSF